MTLTSFAPTSVVTGQALTLNGTNFDRATRVVFSGGASAPVATRSGTTRITISAGVSRIIASPCGESEGSAGAGSGGL